MILFHSMNEGSVVGTLKSYLMQRNLFELFALIGGGNAKTSGVSVCTLALPAPSLAAEPPG